MCSAPDFPDPVPPPEPAPPPVEQNRGFVRAADPEDRAERARQGTSALRLDLRTQPTVSSPQGGNAGGRASTGGVNA